VTAHERKRRVESNGPGEIRAELFSRHRPEWHRGRQRSSRGGAESGVISVR
jgi:hypothetical protein